MTPPGAGGGPADGGGVLVRWTAVEGGRERNPQGGGIDRRYRVFIDGAEAAGCDIVRTTARSYLRWQTSPDAAALGAAAGGTWETLTDALNAVRAAVREKRKEGETC